MTWACRAHVGGDAGPKPRTAPMTSRGRRTCSAAPLWPSDPMPCGWPTSRIFQPTRAFYTSRPSRIWPRARSSAGPWRSISRRDYASTPWSWLSSAASRRGGSFIIATAACKVDSSGRRNTAYVSCSEELVQSLGRCSPAQGLSRPAVEGHRHGCQVLGAVHAEVGALWKVLAQQPVGVLVRAALPGAVGIAEVDLKTGVDP